MEVNDTYRHKGLRRELVAVLKAKGITNENVLAAIERIPRHLFFGKDTVFHETYAYEDGAYDIGEGQTISRPHTVARQSELLEIKPGEKVLEIGTGSGYQALVLMLLKAKVYSIERHKILHERTSKFLPKMKEYLVQLIEGEKAKPSEPAKRTWKSEPEYWNVKCFYGDGFEGLPMHAPFDKIIITAAIPVIPEKLLTQLSVGGKIVFPLGAEKDCIMMCWTKHNDTDYTKEVHDKFAFVPMLKGKVS
ncbi:MAG: protein-L-isoaspartate O-methyltransferase [Bacteroidetes bacterium]|nr:protein-L-isoaspartate O-methyltransferase [Bacteroidota bacterium]